MHRFNFEDSGSLSLLGSSAPLEVAATSSGTCHSVVMWWETQLAPGVTLSTSPHHPPQVEGISAVHVVDQLYVPCIQQFVIVFCL